MDVIERLHHDIKNRNSSTEEFAKVFYEIAKILMNEYILEIEDMKIEFTEIEFYYFDEKRHTDPYVHKHPLQKNINTLYVHPKWGNYGGIDLTFGDDNCYGGILIRGIKLNNKYICGPAKVRDEINKKFNAKTYFALQKNLDNEVALVQISKKDETILRSTRIGLSGKNEDFYYALYRFVREDYFEAKNKKEIFKGNLKEITNLIEYTKNY